MAPMRGHFEHHERHPRDRLGRPLPPGTPNQLPMPVEPEEIATSQGEVLGFAALLFDAGRFFEAHEFFEHLWKSERTLESDRGFWQGLTQLAAAHCHVQRGNRTGAYTLFHRAIASLEPYPRVHRSIDARALVRDARRGARSIERGKPVVPCAFPFEHRSFNPLRGLIRLLGALGAADAVWMAARPEQWSAFWRRWLGGARRNRKLAGSWAILQLAVSLGLLFGNPPRSVRPWLAARP